VPLETPIYSAEGLIHFAAALLQRAGLPFDRAEVVARALVEADSMGHSTHGLQLLSPYLKQLEKDTMTKTGEPEIVHDHGAALTWDGNYLPGPWLIHRALDFGFERIEKHPVVTISIRRSHHIACLAAYLLRATERNLFMLLACSDPSGAFVAPYGGVRAVYTPNPIACGIPTSGDPILFDTSMSVTANGPVMRARDEKKKLPYPWLMDADGNLTDDPAMRDADPPATILPLGGLDAGYKGFALGLMIEAMTSALAGHGRADEPKRWGASVFLQLINPAAFGGTEVFLRETNWLAEACRQSPHRPGGPPVRLPGERALKLRREQLQNGVRLYPTIMPSLAPWADRFGLHLPEY
jgi:LDH2 family malate/lactate/ureidoglycolate dehydrogenase